MCCRFGWPRRRITISIGLEICVRNTKSALPLEPVHIGIVTYRYQFRNRTPHSRQSLLYNAIPPLRELFPLPYCSLGKIRCGDFTDSPFRESLLYFSQWRSLSVGKVSFRYPSVFLSVGRGKGRTRHDIGIHMTRRCALHGLHPYRYVRHSVRPERVPPSPGPPTPLIR